MSSPTKTFITMRDFVKRVQHDSKDWRKVLKPGVRVEITHVDNTKTVATPERKPAVDSYGTRIFTAKDPARVYMAKFVEYGPSEILGKPDPEMVVLELNIPPTEREIEEMRMDANSEDIEIPATIPKRIQMRWDTQSYYVNPMSFQKAGRRHRGTRRARKMRKTRRSMKA